VLISVAWFVVDEGGVDLGLDNFNLHYFFQPIDFSLGFVFLIVPAATRADAAA
jgi:hypothetical protein